MTPQAWGGRQFAGVHVGGGTAGGIEGRRGKNGVLAEEEGRTEGGGRQKITKEGRKEIGEKGLRRKDGEEGWKEGHAQSRGAPKGGAARTNPSTQANLRPNRFERCIAES
jgi:hypothetical protein